MMRQFVFISVFIGIVVSSNAVAETGVEKQATKAGVQKCLPAVKKVANFLIENGDAGSYSEWNKGNPNKQIFTSSIERDFSDGTTYASMTVAPVESGQCAAIYDQVSYWEKSCIAVSKQEFSESKYVDSLNKNIIELKSDKGFVTFLMPAGNGCISIKKETIMSAN